MRYVNIFNPLSTKTQQSSAEDKYKIFVFAKHKSITAYNSQDFLNNDQGESVLVLNDAEFPLVSRNILVRSSNHLTRVWYFVQKF